jgi:hypothetical protein
MDAQVIIKILIFLGIAIMGGGIIYAISKMFQTTCPGGQIYDTIQKKCREKCEEPKTYYADLDKCLDCPPGQELVGTQCLGKCLSYERRCGQICTTSDCVEDKPCKISCNKGSVCCAPGQYCQSDDTCGICSSGKLCGNSCCISNNCLDDNCCPDSTVCLDENNKKVCRNPELCETDSSGKCHCCPRGKKWNSTENKCKITCNGGWCEDNQFCITDDQGNEKCQDDKCKWGDYTYTPSDIAKDIPVCQYNDDTYGQSYTTVNNISGIGSKELLRTATIPSGDKDNCSVDYCSKKIAQVNLTDAKFVNGICSGTFDCLQNLPSLDISGNIPSRLGTQACFKDGKFTGKVCLNGQKCIDGGYCLCTDDSRPEFGCKKLSELNSIICNDNGVLDTTVDVKQQTKCKCNYTTISGDRCENKFNADDFNPEWFRLIYINWINNSIQLYIISMLGIEIEYGKITNGSRDVGTTWDAMQWYRGQTYDSYYNEMTKASKVDGWKSTNYYIEVEANVKENGKKTPITILVKYNYGSDCASSVSVSNYLNYKYFCIYTDSGFTNRTVLVIGGKL